MNEFSARATSGDEGRQEDDNFINLGFISRAGTGHIYLVSNDGMAMEDVVNTMLAAFDQVSLVALGERHWSREDATFRISLINSPSFVHKVNDIVIEFA